jgi:hypothetical protein
VYAKRVSRSLAQPVSNILCVISYCAVKVGSGGKVGERVYCAAAREDSLGGDVTDVACACPICRVVIRYVRTWAWRLRVSAYTFCFARAREGAIKLLLLAV